MSQAPPDESQIARLLTEADLLNRTGRHREAINPAMEALRIAEEHGASDLSRAIASSAVGFTLKELGEYRDSEQVLRVALARFVAIFGERHPHCATCLTNLGSVLRATGRFLEAKAAFESALAIRRSFAVTPEDTEVAQGCNNLAVVLQELGDYKAALALHREALGIETNARGRMHPSVAQSLNNVGGLYHQMGAYREAIITLTEALSLWRAGPSACTVEIAETLGNLATIYDEIGDTTSAIRLLEEALDLRRSLLGRSHRSVAVTLGKLARSYRRRGDYSTAKDLESHALDILRRALPAGHPDTAWCLGHLAHMASDLRDFETAIRLFEEAIGIFRQTYGDRHPEVARTLGNLAVTLVRSGRSASAEALEREALGIARETLGEEHPDVSRALFNLAQTRATRGEFADALRLFQSASHVESRVLGQVFSIFSEAQRAMYLDDVRQRLDVFLRFVRAHRDDLPAAVRGGFELVLRRKAIEAEMLASQREAVLAGRYPHCREVLDKLYSLRAQIARKTLDGPGPEGSDEHRLMLRDWRRQQEDVELQIARDIPELDLQRSSRDIDLEKLSAHIPRDFVLVEIVRAHDIGEGGGQFEKSATQPARYDAFVLRPEDADVPRMIELGIADEIEDAISRFRSEISLYEIQGGSSGSSDAADSDASTRLSRAGERVRKLVFDPLLPALEEGKRILISPDGMLHYVPFALLPLPDGGHVLDRFVVDYLSCGRDMLRFGQGVDAPATPPVIVGDPDFDLCANVGEGSSALPSGEAGADPLGPVPRPEVEFFRPLPATRDEAMAIASMLRVTPWLGADAIDSDLKRVRGPEFLHLATHGFIGNPATLRVPNPTSAPDRRPDDETEIEPIVDNPMLHSGLALAGANTWLAGHPPTTRAEDGILTSEDVTGMDLIGTDLVVLSACDTGLGPVRAGEGVLGLRRAFMLAGARSVIMSLFKVPDDRTRELMEEFYGRFLGGDNMPCADALRETQLAFKNRYPTDISWGYFICQGDPRLRRRSSSL